VPNLGHPDWSQYAVLWDHHHRLYNSVKVLAPLKSRLLAMILLGFVTMIMFTVWGCQPHVQPPTWRTRVPLLVWVITFDLSGKGDPASNYATAGIALRIIWPRKLHHYVKVGITSVRALWDTSQNAGSWKNLFDFDSDQRHWCLIRKEDVTTIVPNYRR
jgi:hypothetical protein